MDTPVVSIIVPIYKTEDYLDRCIGSIVNQTYPYLELILVDDGSPDRCPQMCDTWAQRDERITVIHQKNQGQGVARNTGMEHATGDYIWFVDSDDYIVSDAVETAVGAAVKDRADVVVFGMTRVSRSGYEYNVRVPNMPKMCYSDDSVQTNLLPELLGPSQGTGISAGMSAWCSLFSADVIRKSQWKFVSEREIISEDSYSLIALYKHIRKVVLLPKVLYCYCDNQTSFSHAYRLDRYNQLKCYYTKCVELCRSCGYSQKVIHRCAEPFIGNTIATLKQEAAHGTPKAAISRLKMIVDDELLQKVLWEKKDDKVKLKKYILFWSIRNRCYGLCYVLLRMQNAATPK